METSTLKRRQTFSLFALLCLLGACATRPGSEQAAEQPHAVLFPLAVDQYWVYEILLDDEGAIMENQITSSQMIGGTEWFLSIEYGEKFWIRNTAEGQVEAVNLYTKGENAAVFEQLDPKTIREELLYKFPAQAGDSWVTLENVLRYDGKKILTVPAGTFECHSYSVAPYFANKQGQTYSHSCIAEGIGVVYSDNTLPDGKLEISRLKHWGTRK